MVRVVGVDAWRGGWVAVVLDDGLVSATRLARRALLGRAGISLPADLADVGNVPPDDILDAAVVAWSAGRIAGRQASSLPEPPEAGADGSAIAIWY